MKKYKVNIVGRNMYELVYTEHLSNKTTIGIFRTANNLLDLEKIICMLEQGVIK